MTEQKTASPAESALEDPGTDDTDTRGAAEVETPEEADSADTTTTSTGRRVDWRRGIAFGLLPGLLTVMALGAGWLKWREGELRQDSVARDESVAVAKGTTVAMLSYTPATVDRQLEAARDLLTGDFKDSYIKLTTDVVIPGAKQQSIATTASIPAAASVTADNRHAVVLLFVNQSTTIGSGPPSDTASSVKVTLDKINGRWLVSQFDPI